MVTKEWSSQRSCEAMRPSVGLTQAAVSSCPVLWVFVDRGSLMLRTMAGLFVHPRAGSGGGERTSPCHTLSNSDVSGHKDGILNATDRETPVRDREASQDTG